MTGVRLSDRASVAPLRHVHASYDDWRVTSDVPVDTLPDTVLDVILPGRLGRFIYPSDAVFHIEGREATRWADYERVAREERSLCCATEGRVAMQHRTALQREEEGEEDVELEEEEDLEDEEDEEAEDEVQLEEEEDEEELEEEMEVVSTKGQTETGSKRVRR